MNELRESWSEVAERFDALGLKLKLHAESEVSAVDDDLRSALDRLRAGLGGVADALTDVAKDPAVRSDVRELTDAITSALDATAEHARRILARRA